MRLRRKKANQSGLRAAQKEREKSDNLRDQAHALAKDLHRIREENGFAEALRDLIEGRT